MDKNKFISEAKAIFFIILAVLLIKVTVVEAYIVPTGSMENTIMTGDFLIKGRAAMGWIMHGTKRARKGAGTAKDLGTVKAKEKVKRQGL